jgi:hypothetical protein
MCLFAGTSVVLVTSSEWAVLDSNQPANQAFSVAWSGIGPASARTICTIQDRTGRSMPTTSTSSAFGVFPSELPLGLELGLLLVFGLDGDRCPQGDERGYLVLRHSILS